ncbi:MULTISPECIES: cobalamin biosynthesis protein CobG [Roseobacteraceae]|uniref:Ferredoxin-nitrite reductase n=1 Tax=Pseudosulfitobacter pseudonitzschiae TaxID=1402135 RepID=A0A221K3Y8_9RHOB|nr:MULTISPECIES: cobalamin biosynthesis protein CobG [Roseobacteraceae]ASM73580.1 ferredoxin-nitrite reductase [Pseudosulfitobacter pseudonitzschiae]
MSAPRVKGWCPSAHRPMMAADGLVMRVRPVLARLTANQMLGLCTLAQRFGHGTLEITNRANVQIRGVTATGHDRVLHALGDLGLLDADPAHESRRNILVNPFWQSGDMTHRLTRDLLAQLASLPDLPAKAGFAVDCGPHPLLHCDSADIRLEQGENGLILRADSVNAGRAVTPQTAIPALIEMAHWLAANITPDCRRMAPLTARIPLPQAWRSAAPLLPAPPPQVGLVPLGALAGCAFGLLDAAMLSREIASRNITALRLTPWRMVLLEGAQMPQGAGFITTPDDPLMRASACSGAPFCASATVSTRDIARQLAPRTTGTLHVSGCSKGCARSAPADVTLVGRDGAFDLVREGTARDTPDQRGLTPKDLTSGAPFSL